MSMALPTLNSGGALALRDRFSASHFMPDIRRYGATSQPRRQSPVIRPGHASQPGSPRPRGEVRTGGRGVTRDLKEFRDRYGIRCFGGYSSSENAVTMIPVAGMPKAALGYHATASTPPL